MSPMHSWARYYASLGWHIFPLVPGTKSPFAGSRGSSEATCDPAQIDAWWTAHPEANIGTRPSAGGLYVFDVDPRNGGNEGFAQVCAQHGPLSSQWAVTSPGGGFHLYLAARPGARYKGEPAQGIDGKYNGYAVLPPSLHPCGKRYEWAFGAPSSDTRPAPAPAWLEQPERERTVAPTAAHIGSLADVPKIREALALRDPDSYDSWSMAIASLRHWEDTTPDADGVGYELGREWSATSWKHDDGIYDDKWHKWASDRDGARTLGSLLHESGLTREQQMPTAAEVFGAVPAVMPEAKPLVWTTAPVEGFKGPTTAPDVLAELLATNTRNFSDRWHAGDLGTILDDVAWRSGGNCEVMLAVLQQCPALAGTDEQQLRAMIAHNCANRTTWHTIGALTPDQRAMAENGLMARLEVDDGKWVSAQRAIEQALPVMPAVFQRSGQLVRVVSGGRIVPFTVNTLSREVETWLRLEKGGRGNAAKCPEGLARRVLEAGDYQGVGEIAAAIPLPVVRADGSVITAEGLDEQTGLYLRQGATRDPVILDLAGCKAAFAKAWEPFSEFPFHGPTSRGVILAAMLTSVCRPALETAPAFLINAQSYGTGKSLLCDALMTLCGAPPVPMALSTDKAEQAKQLTAIFGGAPLAFYFDNYFGTLRGGSDFCMAMTASTYKARILGKTETMDYPNRAMVMVNGNNVCLEGDVVRRFLNCVLDSGDGLSAKIHGFNPVHLIRGAREQYRGALIDLLVTYTACRGTWRPPEGLPSFEDWNRLVRGCVIWLAGFIDQVEIADPMEALREAQREDAKELLHGQMLDAWEQRFGLEEVRVRDLQMLPVDPARCPLWMEAYEAICMDSNGRQNPQRFAYWLRDHRRKVKDGRLLDARLDTGINAQKWSLRKL